jgi:hypothetical protein
MRRRPGEKPAPLTPGGDAAKDIIRRLSQLNGLPDDVGHCCGAGFCLRTFNK